MLNKIGIFLKFNNIEEEYNAYKYFINLVFDLINKKNEQFVKFQFDNVIFSDKSKYTFCKYPAKGERKNEVYVDTNFNEDFVNTVIIPLLIRDNLNTYNDIIKNNIHYFNYMNDIIEISNNNKNKK